MAAIPSKRDRERFAKHAAPSAIAYQLTNAQAEAARWQQHVAWLTELHTRRAAEMDAGTWPAGRLTCSGCGRTGGELFENGCPSCGPSATLA